MTASIHRLYPSDRTATERLRDAARAPSRMPSGVATAIEVVGLDLPVDTLAAIVDDVVTEFDLVATIEPEPIVVRFERR